MARLEFAILQYLEGKMRIVLQRNEKDLLYRLQNRVHENLIVKGKHEEVSSFTRHEIREAIHKAFNELIKEFKDETIRIV